MGEVSLKEHFDEKLTDLKKQNTIEHGRVVERLDAIEKTLKYVVTWPALGTAIIVGCAIYGVLRAVG